MQEKQNREASDILLKMLVCPACKGEITMVQGSLSCSSCQLLFQIRDGIPVMLLEEAKPLNNL